jgi:hypothetical protein
MRFLPGPPLPGTQPQYLPTKICLDDMVLWTKDETCWYCGKPGRDFGFDLITAIRLPDVNLRRRVIASNNKLDSQEAT